MTDEQADRTDARTPIHAFNPRAGVRIHRGHLPHWRQDAVTYFVTGRLADSMPQEKMRQWHDERTAWLRARNLATPEELDALPEAERNEFHNRFTRQWHTWLDAGYGECVLRRPDIRHLLTDRLAAFQGERYELDAWVVMPNHFHALVTPSTTSLGEVVRHWKGGSSHDINRVLGRRGSLWQAEPYDHIVRSEAQGWHYRRYIADNPIKADLPDDAYAVGVGANPWPSAQALRQAAERNEL